MTGRSAMRFVAMLALLAHMALAADTSAQPAKSSRLDANGDPLPDAVVARLGSVRFQPRRPGNESPDRFRFSTVDITALAPDGSVVVSRSRHEGTSLDVMDTSTGTQLRKLDLTNI